MFAAGRQMPAATWRQPIPVSPEQALRQEVAQLQHPLYGVEQREHATVNQLEAQLHASHNLTGVRESELAERAARQDMQMQRMMDAEAQATMASAAPQRVLQSDGRRRSTRGHGGRTPPA